MLDLLSKRFLLFLRSERNASPHTLLAYEKDLKAFIHFLNVHGHTLQNLKEFRQARLMVREYWVDLSKKKAALSTLLRKLAVVRSFFKFLIRENVLEINPFNYLPLPKRGKTLPKFLSEKEVSSFISTIENGKHKFVLRDLALIELLYSSGIRIQEALHLNVESLDLWNGMVHVLGKGNKERLVPLGRQAVKCLEKYLGARRVQKGPVFLNPRGARLTPRGARKIILRWLKQTTLNKKVSPHTFRHSFATHLLNQGCDLRMVQEMLGHKSLATTQIYTSTSVEHLRKVMEMAHPRS